MLAMKSLWIASLLLSCIVGVHASSDSSSSSSSSSGSSNDVSSVRASSESGASSESAICIALRTALDQTIEAGPLDVATLLTDAFLTSLNERLNNFRQAISSGDVTSQSRIIEFVQDLQGEVKEVIDECDLDSDEGFGEDDLEALLDAAFDVLLQDLISGLFGCFVVEDFVLKGIILRKDRPNFIKVSNSINENFSFQRNRAEFAELASCF